MNALSPRLRLAVVLLAVLLLGGGSLGYVLRARDHAEPRQAAADASFTLAGPRLYYRDAGTGRVAYREPAPAAVPVVGGPSCERFHAAGDTALCLQQLPGLPARADAVVLDRRLRETQRITLPGIPNRARVSASGRMLSWTMFATGDSYATSAFSTRTSILDLNTGYLIKSMEQIPLTLDGARYHAPDVNFWGVTFAKDDNRFYATVATKGRTYLVQGDLAAWSATALRENVECPSLSPDNTRIAFKKRVTEGADAPWRLYVLDLRTMTEHPLAEPHSVDDQAAWLDDGTIAYALPAPDGHGTDVWSVPADGTGAPSLTVPGASSPVEVG
ncbi:TolB family protein [Kitasatospora sp. NPDC101801]|uniref:TolB family protein n=1 Tax=Kitasatospora sp. NPDC101801 TaxID=3364103 RepID=UPI003823DCBB